MYIQSPISTHIYTHTAGLFYATMKRSYAHHSVFPLPVSRSPTLCPTNSVFDFSSSLAMKSAQSSNLMLYFGALPSILKSTPRNGTLLKYEFCQPGGVSAEAIKGLLRDRPSSEIVLLIGVMVLGQSNDHSRFSCGLAERQAYVSACSVKKGKLYRGQPGQPRS